MIQTNMVRVIPEIENVSYALGTLGMTGLVRTRWPLGRNPG